MTLAKLLNIVGFKVNESDVDKVNSTINSIKDTATKVLGAIGIGLSLASVNELVEEFTRVNQQIKNSTADLGDQREIQDQIMASAAKTRSSYAETGRVVADLVKGNSKLFANVDEAVKFNDAATMLFKTAGKTNEEIAMLMEAINKSFQKGYVDSETISQLLENSPEAVELLNKQLGTTSDKLEDMATDGTFSVQDLRDAFINASGQIESEFDNVQYSITDGLAVIRSRWGLWLAQTNETMGITDNLGRIMVTAFDKFISVLNTARNGVQWLADKLGGTNNLFKTLAILAGAAFVAFNFSKITYGLSAMASGLGTVIKLVKNLRASTLLVFAAFTIVALLVEDFINFMQGNDSLFGSLLENAGVDIDEFRQNVIKIWDNITTALSGIWQGICNVASDLFEGLKEIVSGAFGSLGGIIDKVAPQFAQFIEDLANGDVDVSQWVQVGETIAKIATAIAGAVVAFKTVITVIKTVTTVVKGVSAAISFLTSPVGIVIAIIGALIAIGVLLYQNWDKIKQTAINVWNAICTFFQTIGTNIANFFTNIWNNITSFLTNTWNNIVTTAQSIWQAIVDFFVGIWNNIVSTVSTAVNTVWTTISTIFTSIWTTISSIVNNIWTAIQTAWNNILTTITTIVTSIWTAITTYWNNVFTTISTIVNQIWTTITTVFTNIWNGIVETVSGIYNSIVEGFTAAIDWIKSLPGQAVQWGIDIIQGIINGIKSAIGGVVDAVAGVAQSIKNFLGFSEPEEGPLSNFHTYMPDMMDLMTKGINENKGRVRKALQGLTSDMALIVNAGAAGTGIAGAAVASNQVNRSVVQNVNINNRFEGDKAIQQQAAGAMDKSARDVTAELARGLAYAR